MTVLKRKYCTLASCYNCKFFVVLKIMTFTLRRWPGFQYLFDIQYTNSCVTLPKKLLDITTHTFQKQKLNQNAHVTGSIDCWIVASGRPDGVCFQFMSSSLMFFPSIALDPVFKSVNETIGIIPSLFLDSVY